jgi:hypothetical protein
VLPLVSLPTELRVTERHYLFIVVCLKGMNPVHQKKRPRRPRGKRGTGDVPAADVHEDACEFAPEVCRSLHKEPQTATIAAAGSRGTSPTTDDRASVLSSASSAALQHLKERSRGEHERRGKAFLRLEAERESSYRLDVTMSENEEREQLLHAARTSLSVLAVLAAQRKATGNLFLQRQHAQEREVLEDAETEQRDEVLDEEVESLSFIITRMVNAMASLPLSDSPSLEALPSSTTHTLDGVREGDDGLFLGDTSTPQEAHDGEAAAAFSELRGNAPTSKGAGVASSKSDGRMPPPPRTAESVCPCSIM